MTSYHIHVYRANRRTEKIEASLGEALEEYLTKYKIEQADLRFRPSLNAEHEAPYASLVVTLHPKLGNTIFTFIGCYCDGEFDEREDPPF